jgi:hypothetical protein
MGGSPIRPRKLRSRFTTYRNNDRFCFGTGRVRAGHHSPPPLPWLSGAFLTQMPGETSNRSSARYLRELGVAPSAGLDPHRLASNWGLS